MPVLASRFSPFPDNATNIGIKDFLDLENKDPLSSVDKTTSGDKASEESKMCTCDGDPAAVDAAMNGTSPPDYTPITTDTQSRMTRDPSTSFTSMADKLTQTQISRVTGNNSIASSLVSKQNPKCSTKLAGYGSNTGKTILPTASCNGNKMSIPNTGCDVSPIRDAVNSVSGGKYPIEIEKLDEKLKAIVALSNFSYEKGLCGIFPALSTITKNVGVLNEAAGQVLADVLSKDNINAYNNIATVVGDIEVLAKYPNAIKDAVKGFKMPKNIKDVNVKSMYDTFKKSTDTIAGFGGALKKTGDDLGIKSSSPELCRASDYYGNTDRFDNNNITDIGTTPSWQTDATAFV